ncbi:RNA polymerase sigma factor SigJ [Roseibium salinum]|uniref:RNA polymerase sigma factor SigJ n=1 Tax=Roseibium salinum TaxID=1604349 RepID=A0ABT3R5Z9_9HYPH|nr:RNA polymerase sigma factor SigJ [Roseibium sp. DSM 29163]MCX2724707.1 RNA polymerase sigma factor SigJ [Roseibium sp. DSM 29163]MDN3721302.1 RNA polymerase sigma factor SigJ [Roseibium salinum]
MTGLSDRETFETARPRLLGLAYRMLGSMADAEDAVQDTFLKWQDADTAGISNADAFLTTVCTNRCLDLLKSAHKKRVDYVGPWIPEPLHIELGTTPESDLDRAQSLTTAFLLLLERLSPKERAAYLLHEVFGTPHAEVALTLGISETAARQLVSRAARHITNPVARFIPPADHQNRYLTAFVNALETGSTDHLAGLLAESVRLQTDGGGKTTALRRTLEGAATINKYISRILGRLWAGDRWDFLDINGIRGLVVYEGSRVATALTLGYSEDGKIDQVYIIRNPEKLNRLTAPLRHHPESGALSH